MGPIASSEPGLRERPIADGLFTWPAEEPQLIGSRCEECAATTFPGAGPLPALHLDRDGRGAPPADGVAVDVDRPGLPPEVAALRRPDRRGLRALRRRLRRARRRAHGRGAPDRDRPRASSTIGMEMELVLVPLFVDDDGNDVLTYAFAPVDRPRTNGAADERYVAIVGIGMHAVRPPRRRLGPGAGRRRRAARARRRRARSGRDMQFAVGRQRGRRQRRTRW